MNIQSENRKPLPMWFLLFRAVMSFALGWFRWTQLTAMAAMWGIALLMVAALFLLSDVEQSMKGAESLLEWSLNAPIIGPWLQPYLTEGGGESLTMDDLKAALFWTWTIGALVLAAVAALLNRWLGPFEPWSLKKKLGLVAAACAALFIAFAMAVFRIESAEDVTGNPWITGVFLTIFVLGVSVWAVSISHVIGLVQKGLSKAQVVEELPA